MKRIIIAIIVLFLAVTSIMVVYKIYMSKNSGNEIVSREEVTKNVENKEAQKLIVYYFH